MFRRWCCSIQICQQATLRSSPTGILVEKSKARDDMQKKSLESQQAQVSGEIGRLNALINDVGGVLNA